MCLYDVRKDGKWGYIESQGSTVVPMKYTFAGGFSEGLGCVLDESELLRIVNSQGETVGHIENICYASKFSCGLLCVERNGKRGFVNDRGSLVIDFCFDFAIDFVHDLAIVMVQDRYGIIAKDGRYVLPCVYSYISQFHADSIRICAKQEAEHWHLIDFAGTSVSKQIFGAIHSEREGLAPARRPNELKWGWIDTSGEFIAEPQYDQLNTAFFDGTIGFEKQGRWGVVDRSGSVLVSPCYSHVAELCSGRRRVYINGEAPNVLLGGKYGYLNSEGEMCIKPDFDLATNFENNAAKVFIGKKKDALLGWIDNSGNYLWSPQR